MQRTSRTLGYLIFWFDGLVNKKKSQFCSDKAQTQIMGFFTNENFNFHNVDNIGCLQANRHRK